MVIRQQEPGLCAGEVGIERWVEAVRLEPGRRGPAPGRGNLGADGAHNALAVQESRQCLPKRLLRRSSIGQEAIDELRFHGVLRSALTRPRVRVSCMIARIRPGTSWPAPLSRRGSPGAGIPATP